MEFKNDAINSLISDEEREFLHLYFSSRNPVYTNKENFFIKLLYKILPIKGNNEK